MTGSPRARMLNNNTCIAFAVDLRLQDHIIDTTIFKAQSAQPWKISAATSNRSPYSRPRHPGQQILSPSSVVILGIAQRFYYESRCWSRTGDGMSRQMKGIDECNYLFIPILDLCSGIPSSSTIIRLHILTL